MRHRVWSDQGPSIEPISEPGTVLREAAFVVDPVEEVRPWKMGLAFLCGVNGALAVVLLWLIWMLWSAS